MHLLSRAFVATILAVAAVAALAAPAQADTISFEFINVTSNSASSAAFAEDFTLTVSNEGLGTGADIRFTLTNNRTTAGGGRIVNAFWDTNSGESGVALLSSFTSLNGGTWTSPATQANPPGWNNILPAFASDFSAEANDNDAKIDPQESGYFEFSLADDVTFAQVISAIYGGELRIAFHAQGFAAAGGGTTSDTFSTTIVPEPASIALMALGLGAAYIQRRRRVSIRSS